MTEKPMATRWHDGLRMVKACDDAAVRLFVVKQNRLNATLQTGLKNPLDEAIAGSPEQVQIMYGVGGERWLPELIVPWLPGYENSKPVRIGNAAYEQKPLETPANDAGLVAQTLQAAQGGGTATSNSRREAVTNYEVDKTIRVTRNATGTIKRLNAAVVLNHRTVTDAKGKTTTQPISQEELDKLTALVRETIGLDDKRGDSIKVVNTPFHITKEETDDTPLWKRPETIDIVRTLALPLGLALAAVIVVFGAIRPAIQAAKPPEPTEAELQKLNAVVDDAHELPGFDEQAQLALEGPAGPDARLEAARQFARDNPMAMANVVRGWMNN